MGDRRIFLKPSTPLSLMTIYRMSLISAGSISLDSTFKLKSLNFMKSSKYIEHVTELAQLFV